MFKPASNHLWPTSGRIDPYPHSARHYIVAAIRVPLPDFLLVIKCNDCVHPGSRHSSQGDDASHPRVGRACRAITITITSRLISSQERSLLNMQGLHDSLMLFGDSPVPSWRHSAKGGLHHVVERCPPCAGGPLDLIWALVTPDDGL